MKVSARQGSRMVRSSTVAGGAKFGEKEFRRGAVSFRWLSVTPTGARGNLGVTAAAGLKPAPLLGFFYLVTWLP